MKKILVLLVLVISLCFVTSCEFNKEALSVINDAMDECFKDVDLNNVTNDLEFVEQIGEVKVSYTSSNEEVLSTSGAVNPQEENTIVTIKVAFSYQGFVEYKEYLVTVLADDSLNLSDVKSLPVGSSVEVEAIVAFVVYGTEKNVPVGFYVFDDTDAIYVHSSEYAEVVVAGNKVEIIGTYENYINEKELSSAENAGYTGSRQIVPISVVSDGKIHEIPTSFVKSTSIASLCEIPVSENITSNVYKVVAQINKSQGNGFVNYYFNDLDGINSYYAYTTANGKDLAWLEQYDGTVRECIIAVHNCKLSASGNFWRIVPLQILDEVEVSDEEYMEYALDRLDNQFSTEYNNPCTFEVANVDSLLEGAVVSYESKSEGLVVEASETGYNVTLNFGTEKVSMTIVITIEYNGKKLSKEVSFDCEASKPEFDTISIADARKAAVDENVTIEGYIAGFLYLKGTSAPAGFELVDETSSIAVFVSTAVDTNTDITKLRIGEFVIVNGNGDLYQPREDHNHTGSIRLNEAEVLYHDWQEHELPTEAILEKEFDQLVLNPSDNNISNMVFKTTMYVERSSGSYVNYYIHDLKDPSLSMIVYSQNSGKNGPAEYDWLAPYAGKCVEAYVTLRIGAVSSGKFVWKAGVLQVLDVVETPDSLLAYYEKSNILACFASEYAASANVEYKIPNGVTLEVLNNSSSQVTAKVEAGVLTVNVAEPTTTEQVTLSLSFKVGDVSEVLDITFNVVKPDVITLQEFRDQAQKKGPTVVVEGIVSALVKSSGQSTWTFYLTDGTATIFSYSKAAVEVGDMVRIQGQIDIYYGLPQISNGTVTILSKGNEVPTESFNKDYTLSDVVADATAGEASKNGGKVYVDVIATLNITSSGEEVSLTVGDDKIAMYNYTNASYYTENYQSLESLNGKEVKVTIIAYNWYKTQYTYVIASCEVVE